MKKLSRRTFITICSGTAASLGLAGRALAGEYSGLEPSSPGHSILPPEGNRLRFDELVVQDHRCLKGLRWFNFDPARNVIVGANGSGKTTIVNALASAGDPETNVEVKVRPQGAERLLQRHRDLVFVRDDFNLRTTVTNRLDSHGLTQRIEESARRYFRQLLPHADHLLQQQSLYEFLRYGNAGTGSSYAAGWSFLLAERDTVPYRLPLVMDNPFSRIDLQLKESLSRLLARLEAQVILLTNTYRLDIASLENGYFDGQVPRYLES